MKRYRSDYLSVICTVVITLLCTISLSYASILEPFSLKLPYESFIKKYNTVNSDNPYIPKIVNIQETSDIEEMIFHTDRAYSYIDILGAPYYDGSIDCIVLWTERADEDLNYLTNIFLGILNTMDFPYDAEAWARINIFFDEIVNQRKRIAILKLINKQTNEQWVCKFERVFNKYTNRFESHRIGITNDMSYNRTHNKL